MSGFIHFFTYSINIYGMSTVNRIKDTVGKQKADIPVQRKVTWSQCDNTSEYL